MATKKHTAGASEAPAAAPEVGNYLVGKTPILQNGKRFEMGDTITCTPTQAVRLGLMPATPVATNPDETQHEN